MRRARTAAAPQGKSVKGILIELMWMGYLQELEKKGFAAEGEIAMLIWTTQNRRCLVGIGGERWAISKDALYRST